MFKKGRKKLKTFLVLYFYTLFIIGIQFASSVHVQLGRLEQIKPFLDDNKNKDNRNMCQECEPESNTHQY